MARLVTSHYVCVDGRLVHYRRSGDGPPVVLLHASPRSSIALVPLMQACPADITVFAFDTPGCGYSAPLPLGRPDVPDYAHAFAATLDALGIQCAPTYGTHTGAAIALTFAALYPERVSQLVLDGLSAFCADERAAILAGYLPPFTPHVDGTHLAWLWARVRDQYIFFPWNHRGAGARLRTAFPSALQLHEVALDLLAAGDNYRAPYTAAFSFIPQRWLPHLRVPTCIGARHDDMLFGHLERLGTLPPGVELATFPDDRQAWATAIWRLLGKAEPCGSSHTNACIEAKLPAVAAGDAYVRASSSRMHLRGTLGGTGKPLIVLHGSPGGARGMDRYIERARAQGRPVIAPDLPGHGDSDAIDSTGDTAFIDAAQAVHAAVTQCGISAADVDGEGLGTWVAHALQDLYPHLYTSARPRCASLETVTVPGSLSVSADGAHLAAAWYHMRDEAIFGHWLDRQPSAQPAFGDSLDTETIHRRTIEALKEGPSAWRFRSGALRFASE